MGHHQLVTIYDSVWQGQQGSTLNEAHPRCYLSAEKANTLREKNIFVYVTYSISLEQCD